MSVDKELIIRKCNVKVIGKGKQTLMFAHGFIGDQTMWRYVVPAFEEDYRIILFDFMGCGKSDPGQYDKEKYSRLEGYAEDVSAICQALDLREIIFIGHSIASMIGLIACIQNPQYFSKLIFIGPSPSFINDGSYFGGFDRNDVDKIMAKIERDYSSWAKEIAPSVMNAPHKPELSDELVDSITSRDQKSVRLFAGATFFADYRKDLLKLKTPSLIVQCSEDIMAPLQVGDYLHAHLDKSTLKVLNAKGHFPQLSAPEELVKIITRYLATKR